MGRMKYLAAMAVGVAIGAAAWASIPKAVAKPTDGVVWVPAGSSGLNRDGGSYVEVAWFTARVAGKTYVSYCYQTAPLGGAPVCAATAITSIAPPPA